MIGDIINQYSFFAGAAIALAATRYGTYFMLVDWGFAAYILVRRWQLGYPLHEYAKDRRKPKNH